jgi:UDP-N-acetylglucosamine--N-acetylmuramyl-(pentapeptide) pyrophosphoryl-undecaprenol N-acetylglucosamine transferase
MQIVHISGQLDWAETEKGRLGLSAGQMERYHAAPYLHQEIGAALAAADLVVSRAGASTLGEYPLCGLPAVLVPYPFAWRYQRTNAAYLVERGAAVLLPDEELPRRLLPVVQELMHDENKRKQMAQAMSALARPGAADTIAEVLSGLAVQAPRKGNQRWSA